MDLNTSETVKFQRQCLQRLDNSVLPSANLLKERQFQEALVKSLFNSKVSSQLGAKYQAKQLGRVINAAEKLSTDPENDWPIDALYEHLAELKQSEATDDPLQKVTVSYHPPTSFDDDKEVIRIREKPRVLGSGSDTGHKTWEASLRLANYLWSNPELVRGQNVLELGAGSGLLSMFCAAHLGAKNVVATDCSLQILEACEENVQLNSTFWTDKARPTTRMIDWRDATAPDQLMTDLHDLKGDHIIPDVILGADLIYHQDLAESLANLLLKFSHHRPQVEILIAATERNMGTLSLFEGIWSNGFSEEGNAKSKKYHNEIIDFTCPDIRQQKGLFHTVATPIRLYKLWRTP